MRQRVGFITLELLISLSVVAIVMVAALPMLTEALLATQRLSSRMERSSTALFSVDFITEKMRNTLYPLDNKQVGQSYHCDYVEKISTGEEAHYQLRNHQKQLEVKLLHGSSQPLTGGARGKKTVQVEDYPFCYVHEGGLVEFSATFSMLGNKEHWQMKTAIFLYAHYFAKGKLWGNGMGL